MTVSEKSHKNLFDLFQLLFKKRFEVNNEGIISGDKMRNYGNYIYDYAHSFFGDHFYSSPILVGAEYRIQNALYFYKLP